MYKAVFQDLINNLLLFFICNWHLITINSSLLIGIDINILTNHLGPSEEYLVQLSGIAGLLILRRYLSRIVYLLLIIH